MIFFSVISNKVGKCMDIEFRKYSNDDYIKLLEMITALYDEDPEGQQMDEFKVNVTINEYKKNPQKLDIIMFAKGNKIIGYSILVYYWSNEYGGNILNIDELYVKKEFRNQGIGTYFFSFIEKMNNIVAYQLETTPPNKRALNYYEQLGFKRSKNAHLIKLKI